MNAQKGFTLLELIVVVSIAMLIVTIGVPTFSSSVKNNRLTTEVNRFLSAVHLARSEAIKRGRTITICRSANGNTCGGTDKVYEQGWLLYADTSGADSNYDSTTDTLIKIGDAAASTVTIRSNTIANSWLSFSPLGMLDEVGSASYVFCDKKGSTEMVPGRLLTISITGQAKLTKRAADTSCTL